MIGNEEKIPLRHRLSPIGSASFESERDNSTKDNITFFEQHERLNASLAALTRHIAHVQFGLHQVISAPTSEDRENLLLELHDFASKGIPDVMCQTSMEINERIIEAEKRREKEFIEELKQKLDELEQYAAASGSWEGIPTSIVMEKQRILIDQLREKMDLQLDENVVSKLSTEELRKLVDQAIFQLINPMKTKENLIKQMHTQIADLENFIRFLKADSVNPNPPPTPPPPPRPTFSQSHLKQEHDSSNLSQSIKKILVLTQLYILVLLSCGARSIQPRSDQPTSRLTDDPISNRHFGNLRAKLEVTIEKIVQKVPSTSQNTINNIEQSDNNFTDLVLIIRQDFTSALRALLEHGLHEESSSNHSSIWNCFSMRNQPMHVWKLFLKYYQIKQGHRYTEKPAWKLSQSFALDIVGGKPVTTQQYLFHGIDTIVRLHDKHHKQMDGCFKSFLCYALNEKKLVSFLRLIVQSNSLVEDHYHAWSYTRQTGFNDALHSLDRLSSIDFDLPIDRSIRRFMNEDFILGSDPEEVKDYLHGLGLIPLDEYFIRVKQLLKRQGQSAKTVAGQMQRKLTDNGTSKDDPVKNLPFVYSRKRTSFSPVITRKRGKAIRKRTSSANQNSSTTDSAAPSTQQTTEEADAIGNDQPLDLRLQTKPTFNS